MAEDDYDDEEGHGPELSSALPMDLEHVPFEFNKLPVDETIRRSGEFYTFMNARRTVRFFSREPVPADVIRNIVRAAGDVERVQQFYQRNPQKSTHRASREISMSQPTVWRVLCKRLRFKPYRLQLIQALGPADYSTSTELNFALIFRTSWKTIMTILQPGGSSLQAIKKYIAVNYKVDPEKFAPFIKKYLKSAVASGELVQTKGKGASGSFKLASAAKPEKAAASAPAQGGKAFGAKEKKQSAGAKAKNAAPKSPKQKVAAAKKGVEKKKTAAKPKQSPSKAKKITKVPTKKPKAQKPKKLKMFTREKQISCPYDKAHLIYASKMQSHLVKCERNHQDLKKVVCPFNSVHRMDEESYISHISVCRNRRVIDSHRFYVENQNIFKPHAYKKLVLPPEEEDWDSAPHFPTYNPNDYLDKNCLLRKPVGKSRSERKKFYLKEIVKFERYQKNGIIEETDSEEEEEEDKRSLKESESGYATNTESTISEKQELKLAQLNKINEVPLSPLLGLGRGTSFQRNKIDRDNRPGFGWVYKILWALGKDS
ncbi:hypothetical protein C0J52_26091 [Blattella germanica]|nr:hypothetical protein C0J52_26091 [Blattella germanica]